MVIDRWQLNGQALAVRTVWGTLLGTPCGFFARSLQKTEGKRDKATVFLTAAFFK